MAPEAFNQSSSQDILPILPLKNLVVLPSSIIPIIVGRKSSVLAVEDALKNHNKTIFVTAQKHAETEQPFPEDLYAFGTRATIVQMMKMPNNSLKILVEGVVRSKIIETYETESFSSALIYDCPTIKISEVEIEAAWRNLKSIYLLYGKLNSKVPTDLVNVAQTAEDKEIITDTIAMHSNISFQDRQRILETTDLQQRMMLLTALIKKEIEILQTEERIKGRVQHQVEKNQKEYYLHEQLKAINKELGREDQSYEIDHLRHKIKLLHLPKDAQEKADKELNRLEQMPSMSAESAISKHYIDWILALPWHKKSKDSVSMENAEKLLNKEHSGLQKVKERILEFVAAQKYAQDLKRSPTICLVGAPGVGKTSLAKSIAKSLGKEFTRISLGGVKDEAEIRGHRRTYIGALPGKILHAMRKTKTINPVILLDEIDKISHDMTGDPASALLEVLDPEQNKTFMDHFLDCEYDLSNVMFIATANSIDTIPYPLYDRMEIINLSGYTDPEKLNIAQSFLIPKQLKEYHLKKSQISLSDQVLMQLINEYTKEAGVRQLERLIGKIMRKSIQEFLSNKQLKTVVVTSEKLTTWLGQDKFRKTDLTKRKDIIGIGTGLAWTELGGDILEIEVSIMPGKGNLTLTGQLGEIMQESAQTAYSYVRARAPKLGIKKSEFLNNDFHIHFPDGATPKDGSSAGITIASALVSALTNIPFKNLIAMTGEVTLRGRVLAIGGLKEKLLAAQQHDMTTVLIPKANEQDLAEFKNDVTKLNIIFADQMDFVLQQVLAKDPFKLKKKPMKKKKSAKKK
ncbi:endopeptidase La [candidate division TM6 bacterium RIFCSPHIGHO2_12_FULL_38_8]|nr:MAG: endopeptidase La [candidate division TM6 bacterium RIFCSPHIGHO2_12_FULL_38_8]